jgi:integrase/recombinase XerD
MITEKIRSREFITLKENFTRWLQTLGYSPSTVDLRRRSIHEFLLYLERCGIGSVEKITGDNADGFAGYLAQRRNRKYGSGLSTASINTGISSVNKFFEYLRNAELAVPDTDIAVPDNLPYMKENHRPKEILSLEDIAALYEATYYENHFASMETRSLQGAVSQRDRAMLGIYYGCGLRKSEGTALDVSDILAARGLIHVRKGKGSLERYVPVTGRNLDHIISYLQHGRERLLSNASFSTERFFVNQYGQRCSANGLVLRLRHLVRNSGNGSLQRKNPSLHTLRHSIATHLMQSGMPIEMIRQFLGHRSLESTQIYTHLANEF